MNEEDDEELYLVSEVASILQVTAKTISRWARTGKFEEFGVDILTTRGGHRRFKKTQIDDLLQRMLKGEL